MRVLYKNDNNAHYPVWLYIKAYTLYRAISENSENSWRLASERLDFSEAITKSGLSRNGPFFCKSKVHQIKTLLTC